MLNALVRFDELTDTDMISGGYEWGSNVSFREAERGYEVVSGSVIGASGSNGVSELCLLVVSSVFVPCRFKSPGSGGNWWVND